MCLGSAGKDVDQRPQGDGRIAVRQEGCRCAREEVRVEGSADGGVHQRSRPHHEFPAEPRMVLDLLRVSGH